MRLFPKIKDTQDRESRTLAFVTIAFLLITARTVMVWFFPAEPMPGVVAASISLTEYGTAFAALMAVWLGREWVKK